MCSSDLNLVKTIFNLTSIEGEFVDQFGLHITAVDIGYHATGHIYHIERHLVLNVGNKLDSPPDQRSMVT